MKKCLSLLLVIVLLSSCASQTFYVHGIPGTEIFDVGNNNGTKIGVIDGNGIAKIKMNRKESAYKPMLYAKVPNSNKKVPFALDYKHRSRSAHALFWGTVFVFPTALMSWIPFFVMNKHGFAKYDYDYLKHQNTNNDLIK